MIARIAEAGLEPALRAVSSRFIVGRMRAPRLNAAERGVDGRSAVGLLLPR
ncbi:MAG TPA: hypothetical protein VHK01_05720 [Lacipirellulaceae bacterium]|nr:hypothetical protein [Lacipirellulaceae bacterium]